MKINIIGTLALLIGAFSMTVNANTISQDQAQISSTIQSYATMADQGAFEYLGRVFAPEIVVDYTSLFGGEPQKTTREALMQQWSNFLPGFDTTYHQLSNFDIKVNGDKALASVDFEASHWIGKDGFWQIAGQYDFNLKRAPHSWVITSVKVIAGNESGSRDVLAEAPKHAVENLKARNKLKIKL